MSLYGLETASGESFVKYLLVMHVTVKDMLRILKQCKNNKRKSLVVDNFHKTFETRPTTFSQILWQMIGLIKLHKLGKYHQYTICTFLLTDLQNPRSSLFGPLLGAFSSVTSRIEVQPGAPPVWRVAPSSTLKSNS